MVTPTNIGTGGDATAPGTTTTGGVSSGTTPSLDSINLNSPMVSVDTDAVASLSSGYGEIADKLTQLAGIADKLAGIRPLQYGKSDDTWDRFSEGPQGYVASAQAVADGLRGTGDSLRSVGDQLQAQAKAFAKTEESNAAGAAKMGSELSE